MHVRWTGAAGIMLGVLLMLLGWGCSDEQAETVSLEVPRGYQSELRVELGESIARFGPFVGYYFRPEDPADPARVRFVCFNERGFYSSDAPVNAKLYEGRAVLSRLPGERDSRPLPRGRITPVFFPDAPGQWLASRPEPEDAFLHFHSLHDAGGARMDGYWLMHEAVRDFTYDMGGRVEAGSPLYHRVTAGVDRDFARIIEFDQGPGFGE